MHYLLFYDFTPDYVTRRTPFRNEHLALAWAAAARGELIVGGAVGDPVESGILMFKADSPAVAERFAQADPYVRHGVVTAWRVRPLLRPSRSPRPTRSAPSA